jgi:hypothetical protein
MRDACPVGCESILFMLCGCETHVLSVSRAYFHALSGARRMLCRVRDACSVGCESILSCSVDARDAIPLYCPVGCESILSCSVDARRNTSVLSCRVREHTFMLCGCETHALLVVRAYFHALWMRDGIPLYCPVGCESILSCSVDARDAIPLYCPVGCESILSCSVDARRMPCWFREHTFMLCGFESRNTSVLSCRVREHTFMLCGCETHALLVVRAYFS